MSRPDFFSLCPEKGTKKLAVSPPVAVSARKTNTKKTRQEKLYCKVNLKHSSPQGHLPVNNRDLKEEMSFLYNEYTKNNLGRFLTTGGIKEIKRHFPASVKEWNNSVYAYNSKRTILFSAIDKIVIKLIKSYFNAYFLSSRPKIRKLSVLKRMNISKLELKHTHSKVVIVVYVYCAEFKNLEFLYKNLSDGTKFSLVDLLAKYYNKKVELKVVRLRDMQLNAKILAERLAIELNQIIRSPLRTIRNALKTVRTSKVNLKLYYLKKKSSFIKKYSALYNNISTLNVGDLKKINKTLVRNEVLMSTKYKAITGLKIQIAGRLTRRATAAKAVFKGGQVGGLRNIDSSVLGFSVGLLRGHHKPNIQKAFHNSKTKNGSFNVRVWTSSFYSTLAPSNPKREFEINQINLYP